MTSRPRRVLLSGSGGRGRGVVLSERGDGGLAPRDGGAKRIAARGRDGGGRGSGGGRRPQDDRDDEPQKASWDKSSWAKSSNWRGKSGDWSEGKDWKNQQWGKSWSGQGEEKKDWDRGNLQRRDSGSDREAAPRVVLVPAGEATRGARGARGGAAASSARDTRGAELEEEVTDVEEEEQTTVAAGSSMPVRLQAAPRQIQRPLRPQSAANSSARRVGSAPVSRALGVAMMADGHLRKAAQSAGHLRRDNSARSEDERERGLCASGDDTRRPLPNPNPLGARPAGLDAENQSKVNPGKATLVRRASSAHSGEAPSRGPGLRITRQPPARPPPRRIVRRLPATGEQQVPNAGEDEEAEDDLVALATAKPQAARKRPVLVKRPVPAKVRSGGPLQKQPPTRTIRVLRAGGPIKRPGGMASRLFKSALAQTGQQLGSTGRGARNALSSGRGARRAVTLKAGAVVLKAASEPWKVDASDDEKAPVEESERPSDTHDEARRKSGDEVSVEEHGEPSRKKDDEGPERYGELSRKKDNEGSERYGELSRKEDGEGAERDGGASRKRATLLERTARGIETRSNASKNRDGEGAARIAAARRAAAAAALQALGMDADDHWGGGAESDREIEGGDRGDAVAKGRGDDAGRDNPERGQGRTRRVRKDDARKKIHPGKRERSRSKRQQRRNTRASPPARKVIRKGRDGRDKAQEVARKRRTVRQTRPQDKKDKDEEAHASSKAHLDDLAQGDFDRTPRSEDEAVDMKEADRTIRAADRHNPLADKQEDAVENSRRARAEASDNSSRQIEELLRTNQENQQYMMRELKHGSSPAEDIAPPASQLGDESRGAAAQAALGGASSSRPKVAERGASDSEESEESGAEAAQAASAAKEVATPQALPQPEVTKASVQEVAPVAVAEVAPDTEADLAAEKPAPPWEIGDIVEYYSSTHKTWTRTKVKEKNQSGDITLLCKKGTWLNKEKQKALVRPLPAKTPTTPGLGAPAAQQAKPDEAEPTRETTMEVAEPVKKPTAPEDQSRPHADKDAPAPSKSAFRRRDADVGSQGNPIQTQKDRRSPSRSGSLSKLPHAKMAKSPLRSIDDSVHLPGANAKGCPRKPVQQQELFVDRRLSRTSEPVARDGDGDAAAGSRRLEAAPSGASLAEPSTAKATPARDDASKKRIAEAAAAVVAAGSKPKAQGSHSSSSSSSSSSEQKDAAAADAKPVAASAAEVAPPAGAAPPKKARSSSSGSSSSTHSPHDKQPAPAAAAPSSAAAHRADASGIAASSIGRVRSPSKKRSRSRRRSPSRGRQSQRRSPPPLKANKEEASRKEKPSDNRPKRGLSLELDPPKADAKRKPEETPRRRSPSGRKQDSHRREERPADKKDHTDRKDRKETRGRDEERKDRSRDNHDRSGAHDRSAASGGQADKRASGGANRSAERGRKRDEPRRSAERGTKRDDGRRADEGGSAGARAERPPERDERKKETSPRKKDHKDDKRDKVERPDADGRRATTPPRGGGSGIAQANSGGHGRDERRDSGAQGRRPDGDRRGGQAAPSGRDDRHSGGVRDDAHHSDRRARSPPPLPKDASKTEKPATADRGASRRRGGRSRSAEKKRGRSRSARRRSRSARRPSGQHAAGAPRQQGASRR